MSWKGLVNVTFPSHLQTLMALFPKSKVLKGQVSCSEGSSVQAFGVKGLDTAHILLLPPSGKTIKMSLKVEKFS